MALEPLRATLYDLKTGSYLRRIPATKAPWSKELNGWGKLEVTVPRTAAANLPLLRSLAQPWRTLLVLTRGQRVIHAGPITARPYGDRLVLKGEGFGATFRKRLVLNRALRGITLDGEVLIDEDNPAPEWQLTLNGSYVDIAAQLVAETYEWGPLPVTVPALTGGAMTRTYYGYDFATVEERLHQLTQLEGGPELRFTPELVPGGVTFALEGAAELVNTHHRWNTSIPGDRCTIGTIDDDGEHIVTDQWMLGGRNEDIMLVTRKDDGAHRSAARNTIINPRLTVDLSGYVPTRVSRAYDGGGYPGLVDGVSHNGVQLYDPVNADSFVSVGGDTGALRLGMAAGKTYVMSAEGMVRALISGEGAAEPDAAGGSRNRVRAIVVHAWDPAASGGAGGWRIWHSAPIPNVIGAAVRTSVRFTIPSGATQAFVRFYLGGTKGSITWCKPRLSEVTNADPAERWDEYFWGGKPATDEYTYSWESTPDYSPSIRTIKPDAPSPLIGYPLLQLADTSHSTVSDIGTLRGYAREAIIRGARTQEVIDVHVSAEEDVEPGDWADVRTNHPLYGEVVLPLKVVAVSGDTSERIKLSCRIRNGEAVS